MIRYRTLIAPISVQLELTEQCTNNCIHCYNHWRFPGAEVKTIKKSQLHRILAQLIKHEVFSATFTGGEPLICKEILIEAIKELKKADIDTRLNSNLTLLSYDYAQELKGLGINSILTSLLSCREDIHNQISGKKESFKRTIKGIQTAIKSGIRISVNMVINQRNFSDIYETAKLARELGAKSFSATKISPALNSRNFQFLRLTSDQVFESLEVLERVKNELGISVDILESYPLCLIKDVGRFNHFARRSCSAGKTNCTIGADGFVRPCSHADMVYGNILEEDLSIIWERMSDWRNAEYVNEECQSCKFLPQCSGGCRMEAKYYGDICGRDPYATSPQEIGDLPKKKVLSSIFPDQPMCFVNNLRSRKETFGAVLYSRSAKTIFITEDSFKLFELIKDRSFFTMCSLSVETGYSTDELQKLFGILYQKGFVIPIEGGEIRC